MFKLCLLIIAVLVSIPRGCYSGPCPKICEWLSWFSWSECTATCGGGSQIRYRQLCCKNELANNTPACLQDCGFVERSEKRTCNILCENHGLYYNDQCNCPPEHYGRCCKQACSPIAHCSKVSCTSRWDGVCTLCEDQGGDIQDSVYWPDASRKYCQATCSWKFHRCWPGKCSTSLPSSCVCETGFKKDASAASCDITTKADLEFCKMSVEDTHGETRQTVSGTNSTSCSSEVDVYINIKPILLFFNIIAHVTREGMTTEPNFIQSGSTKIGIVKGTVSLSKEYISGTYIYITEISLHGGGDCNSPLSSTSTSRLLTCYQHIFVLSNISNGERICATVTISSGGSFKYIDYSGSYRGTHYFTPVTQSKMLCFKYDNVPPVHCAVTSTCKQEPLSLSSRVTKSANITVSVSGWIDPHPQHGKPDQASGVDFYKLQVYGMKQLGLDKLTVDYTTSVFTSQTLRGPDHNITIRLPNEPAMYVTYLEVHDVAGNVRFARRFLLYDNTSTLDVRQDKHLRVVSAYSNSNYNWQINHGKIRLDWKHRYHNDYYVYQNILAPIETDTDSSIWGVYDQKSGVLPVAGTENVNGITSFKYKYALNNDSRTPWTPVPDFTNQSLSLDLNLTDGETYEVWIMAEAIMLNSIVESVVVHIDTSVPVVAVADVNTPTGNARITEPDASTSSIKLKNANSVFISAHLQDGKSAATLKFHAYDIHSGISSVDWTLRTTDKDSDVRSGSLKPSHIGTNDGQTNHLLINGYCPMVGLCEFYTYSLPLDLISPPGGEMNNGLYNYTINVTLDIINGAHLTTSLQLTVTVQEMYTAEQHTGDTWSTAAKVGVAIGCGGLVLVAFLGVMVIFKTRTNSNPTTGRRKVDSSPVSQGAEGTDHIYDELTPVGKPFYENIHNHSSTAENANENVLKYQSGPDRSIS